jgi:hypothetical protein
LFLAVRNPSRVGHCTRADVQVYTDVATHTRIWTSALVQWATLLEEGCDTPLDNLIPAGGMV